MAETTTHQTVEPRAARPVIRTIYRDRPWSWLAQGWNDFRRAPLPGLVFGLVFAIAGWIVLIATWTYQIYYLTFPLAAGFLLAGPILAVGLYEVSRRLHAGETAGFGDALRAFSSNPTQVAFFGVILLLIFIAWIRLASLLFMLHFFDQPPGIDPWDFAQTILTVDAIPFLILGNAIGAVLAFVTFAASAIAIPLLLDRPEANVITAVATSWQAVTRNFWTMLLWAWLIVIFIGVGIVTGFLGLIITLPLIGHASWAAYRDLVEWKD
ncbi:MAG: DUF2189 domain-containing protein [Azospirillaceae bacterium]